MNRKKGSLTTLIEDLLGSEFSSTEPEREDESFSFEDDLIQNTFFDDSEASINFDLFDFEDNVSSSQENRINSSRQIWLRENMTPRLLNEIREEDFEFGYVSQSERIITDQFKINKLATRNWLNEIFTTHFNDENILIGLLRILGRFEENIIFPQGQTIALAALNHKNDEIKELGIRSFENWASINSIKILKAIELQQKWLREYRDQVVAELEEELCHI